ncbi:MAG: metalloregulator ArsR/SmtB family transcription factor [Acidobacteriota bacterium]
MSDDDAVWRALADPTRRRILDRLRAGPLTTGALADLFPVSRYAVMKHLKVLVDADLVLIERRGRERYNRLNAVPIRAIYRRWIRPFEETSADRLLRLKEHLESDRSDPENPANDPSGDDP